MGIPSRQAIREAMPKREWAMDDGFWAEEKRRRKEPLRSNNYRRQSGAPEWVQPKNQSQWKKDQKEKVREEYRRSFTPVIEQDR